MVKQVVITKKELADVIVPLCNHYNVTFGPSLAKCLENDGDEIIWFSGEEMTPIESAPEVDTNQSLLDITKEFVGKEELLKATIETRLFDIIEKKLWSYEGAIHKLEEAYRISEMGSRHENVINNVMCTLQNKLRDLRNKVGEQPVKRTDFEGEEE